VRLALLLIVAFTPAFLALAQADQSFIGQVKKVSGSVELVRGGKQITVKVGQTLLKGDKLITGNDGSVGMIFSDDSGLSMGTDSQMTLKDYAFDPARDKLSFWIKLKRGTMVYFSGIIAKIRKNQVNVETPTAVMGVRGTRFAVKVE
jgi:hypothetical protein